MNRSRLLISAGAMTGVAVLALISGGLLAQESLLPPGFDSSPAARPSPAPRPSQAARPAATRAPAPASAPSPVAAQPAAPAAASPSSVSAPVVQPVPAATSVATATGLSDEELLQSIDPELLARLLESARPKADIPPGGRRSLEVVGVVDERDGGLPMASTRNLNGPFVEAVIGKTRGRFVSRWVHILLRRALASRLATPVGMNGADWAAIRASLLLRMGEADLARSMVQAVDSGDFTPALEDAAMASYLATADPVGLCPITALTAARREGAQWELMRAICAGFSEEGGSAMAQLDRAMRRGTASKIDVLLAQKFAGAATNARRAVKIEWDGVETLTPWSIGMSFATGLEPPESLRASSGTDYALMAARAPMLPPAARAAAADVAAARGVFSSAAMIDLYSQIYALRGASATNGDVDQWTRRAESLRTAYVAQDAGDRLEAIRTLWGDGRDPDRAYAGLVLTSHAAARVIPAENIADEAAPLIASMLTAGLDRNALKWARFCPVGSEAWGLLVLSNPGRATTVSGEALGTFLDGDDSEGSLRTRFLLAGLMGLGRVDPGAARDLAAKLSVDFNRQTRWTQAIDSAAASGNPALVSLLAAFGMQADRWDRMTPLHLYHIVSALQRVGLSAEARMIAAEAVSRV